MGEGIEVRFVGIDSHYRPVFKTKKGDYYGSVNLLFERTASQKQVVSEIKPTDLCYFGKRFGCEPMGFSAPSNIVIVYDHSRPC